MCRQTLFINQRLYFIAGLYVWDAEKKDFREVVSNLYSVLYKFLDAKSLPLQFRLDFFRYEKNCYLNLLVQYFDRRGVFSDILWKRLIP